jgi:RNA ligase (TIGR02306 family)
MSKINVKIVKVNISEHPGADRLELATIGSEVGGGGYVCVIGLNQFQTGDLVIYIPPDSVLPNNIMESLAKNKIQMKNNRIRAINIRGILSEGLCLSPSVWLNEKEIKEDNDVTELLGITKYEPPPPKAGSVFKSGKGINNNYQNPKFEKYTDIDNIKKYPKVLTEKDRVVATIKTHGTNFRCGWVGKPNYKKSLWKKFKDLVSTVYNGRAPDPTIDKDAQEFLVGSHKVIRYAKKGAEIKNDLYWRAAIKYKLKEVAENMAHMLHLIEHRAGPHDIIIYAEIIGPKVQVGYSYGIDDGDIEIRIFDIKFNGKYIDWGDVQFLCADNKVPCAHSVYEGPWYPDLVKKAEVVDEHNGKKFNREGLVIKPVKERWDHKCGRVIFKAINPNFLLDKKNSENH